MTLITTAITPSHIWQATDNRVSKDGIFVDDESVKHVGIRASDGSALVGFTGLAEFPNNIKTIDWVREVLRSETRNLIQTFTYLKQELDKEFETFLNPPKLLFSIGVFSNKKAYYVEVTNIIKDLNAVSKSFEMNIFRISKPEIFIAGSGRAHVGEDDKIKLIKAMIDETAKDIDIHDVLAEINGRVSEIDRDRVSQSCVTVDVPSAGLPFNTKIHGTQGQYVIPLILLGIDLTETLKVFQLGISSRGASRSDKRWNKLLKEAARRSVEPKKIT